MNVACPHCAGHVLAEVGNAGQVMACPFCEQHFRMPALDTWPGEDAPGPPPPPPPGVGPVAPLVGRYQPAYGQDVKSPGLAAVLSFFWAGLGQIYNGRIGKGIAMIILQFVNACLVMVCVGVLTYPIVWIWGMYDAYAEAERINAAARQAQVRKVT